MKLNEYQKQAIQFAIYPRATIHYDDDHLECGFLYPALGLAGEAGEVAEKIKKLMRDRIAEEDLPKIRKDLTKELGDVMWYVANLAYEFGIDMDDIGETNIAKLSSRKSRDKIHGSGDDR